MYKSTWEVQIKELFMYKLMIGEICEKRLNDWRSNDPDAAAILKNIMFETDCSMGTLPIAGKNFHDEVQIDWGSFAWKAFRSELKKFFKRKGLPEAELAPFDEYKEYGVVYIDE